MREIHLTRDQTSEVMLNEIEYQLTVMKQYLSKEEKAAYLLLLDRYGSLIDRQIIMERHEASWS